MASIPYTSIPLPEDDVLNPLPSNDQIPRSLRLSYAKLMQQVQVTEKQHSERSGVS